MNLDSPSIDILMPVYNCSDYLAEAIESVLNQTHPIEKIIILDDCSTDNTLAIAQKYQQLDTRIQLLTSTSNMGLVYQLNRGLKESKATYIARMDGDDISSPNRLTLQVAHLEANPACVANSGAYSKITKDGELIQRMRARNRRENLNAIPAKTRYLLHPFLMVRGNILRKIRYREIHHCEDQDLYFRLQDYGSLINIPDWLGNYRIHPKSITSNSIAHNMLQALNSQLLCLFKCRPTHDNYSEALARTVHSYFFPERKQIKEILTMLKKDTKLSAFEATWISLAFPFKAQKNTHLRHLQLNKEELDEAHSSMLTQLWPQLTVAQQIKLHLNKQFFSNSPLKKLIKTISSFFPF